jgi:chromosome partitioning protein
MPRIVAIIAQKGGTGKSTVCLHLAAMAGSGVVLLDTDPQGSCADWWQVGSREVPEVIEVPAAKLDQALTKLKDRPWVFVDTGPAISHDAKLVAERADLVLVVTRPSPPDLRAIRHSLPIVKATKAKAAILLNACPVGRGTGENGQVTDARDALVAYGLPLVPVTISHRVALQHAFIDGRLGWEVDPKSPAQAEFTKVWSWINAAAA